MICAHTSYTCVQLYIILECFFSFIDPLFILQRFIRKITRYNCIKFLLIRDEY
jgi:hypothetical protein